MRNREPLITKDAICYAKTNSLTIIRILLRARENGGQSLLNSINENAGE